MSDTSSESDDVCHARQVGIVTYILRYDDLLAADATAMPPLGGDVLSIELGRTVGRSEVRVASGSLSLPDSFVSGHHARIERRGVVDLLRDLGSKHGTRVNGEPLAAGIEHALRDGDLFEVGHSLLIYRLVSPQLAKLNEVMLGPTRTLSPEVMHLARELARIAPTETPVLLLGEPGTGKEIAAQQIHQRSRRTGPMVAIDCGAISEPLIESELFGHHRGAFSGATGERKGRIRSGDKGTVFLDEIGNLSRTAQQTLLRAIQEREVVPVGSDKGQKVDVRWIAATNADVSAKGAQFRPDLYERLAGYVGRLPPLRKRREDLGILTAHILKKAGVHKAAISKQAGRMLFGSTLPGNIRELENTLRRAIALAEGNRIEVPHLKHPLLDAAASSAGAMAVASAAEHISRESVLASGRRVCPSSETVREALDKAGGVQGKAARLLGVDERQLRRWMDDLGIPRAKSRS